jgi:ankyrin repeat protein
MYDLLRLFSSQLPAPRRIPVFHILMLVLMIVPTFNALAGEKRQAQLVNAITAKDSTQVAALLESGAYIEQTNSLGITPLMAAAGNGDEKLVRLLLAMGANVNTSGSNKTPLAFAATEGCSTMVRMLLEAGSSVDSVDFDGNTPLMLAAQKGDLASVLLLLEYGADYRKTNFRKQNLLMSAAMAGNHDIVTLFLDKKISGNEQDADGFTALVHSLAHPEIARYLVNSGADPTAMVTISIEEQNYRFPILALAAILGNESSVSTLIELGAKINEKGSYGITPLLAACMAKNWDVVLLLLQKGAECDIAMQAVLEAPELSGVTPLIFAAESGKVEVVRLLLQKNVQVNQRSDANLSALMVAEMGGHTEVAEMLRQHGANIGDNERKEAEEVRKRTFDSLALLDAKNAKTSLEAYFVAHQSYPDSFDKTSLKLSEGVTISYEPLCDSSCCHSYVVSTTTAQGGHEFKAVSGSAKILKRSLGERFAGWEE